uniref:Zinc finger protein 385C n=1 Tax=Varanus komodoensis TaxID=61221 RepID=A0A8D2LPT3_VARKO
PFSSLKPDLHPEHINKSKAIVCFRLSSSPGCPPEQHSKREKKHAFTLCEVCNIQLNSAVQAQIHYNGKTHQKRLRQLNKGKVMPCQGKAQNACKASRNCGEQEMWYVLKHRRRPLHPPLDIKNFLTFRLSGTPPLNLFPNFNTMDPVQKAVINHTFGIPNPLKKKQFISCNICHLRFNSANQAEAHYRGHKHARRLRAIETVKNKHKMADSSNQEKRTDFDTALDLSGGTSSSSSSSTNTGHVASPSTVPQAEMPASESDHTTSSAPDTEKEGKKNKHHLYCPTCKVTVNSASQLEAHNSGKESKHKSMLEGQAVLPRRGRGKVLSRVGHKPKRIGSKGSLSIQSKAFQCQVCEIFVNSETQLNQHMSSRRHKDRLAGKPPKPKFSPYSKLQKNTALASKLALQKHLTKTLAARFLPSPLTTATMCALPSPLTLRPAAATLFQAPIFGPALFRTTPGPVRAATGPIVFAPY